MQSIQNKGKYYYIEDKDISEIGRIWNRAKQNISRGRNKVGRPFYSMLINRMHTNAETTKNTPDSRARFHTALKCFNFTHHLSLMDDLHINRCNEIIHVYFYTWLKVTDDANELHSFNYTTYICDHLESRANCIISCTNILHLFAD